MICDWRSLGLEELGIMGVSLERLAQAINGRIELLLGSGLKLFVKGAGAVWGSTTVGYGPGLSKSSYDIERSSLNCHLRNEHITHFIWLISWRANIPCQLVCTRTCWSACCCKLSGGQNKHQYKCCKELRRRGMAIKGDGGQ